MGKWKFGNNPKGYTYQILFEIRVSKWQWGIYKIREGKNNG